MKVALWRTLIGSDCEAPGFREYLRMHRLMKCQLSSSFLIQLQAACQFIAATLYDTLRMRSEGEFIKNSITLLRRTTQRLFPNKTGRISYISTSDRGIPIKYFVRRLKTVNRKRSVFAPDAYMYGCKKYKKAQGVGRGEGDEQCSLFDCRSFYWKERA